MNVVEMQGIYKAFGSVKANTDVNFTLKKGEIHSLLGENGAGKTTLMNILYGLYFADTGIIKVNGKKVNIKTPLEATANGIAMVHQHFMLVDKMTVAENVVLGLEPKKGIFFDLEQAYRDVESISTQYGLKVDPREMVSNLPVGMKQRVEILKALYRKADILILDEPTAVLTPGEVQDLFVVLRELRDAGKSIVLITHKLKETMLLADTVTILRQGKIVDSMPKSTIGVDDLAEMMVGRRVSFNIDKKPLAENLHVCMEVINGEYKLKGVAKLQNINLQVRGGEVLGIAGVEGNGQTELIEVLTGIVKLTSGTILIEGEEIHNATPAKMLEKRVGHIPEDRSTRGVIKTYSISKNLILGYQATKRFSKKITLKLKAIDDFARENVAKFDIRCSGIGELVENLSGGNQQKVVIGRVISENPQIVIAAQPTRGVDIGAIEYIHEQLITLRDEGKAILLISADLDEVVKLSDRIVVIYGGRLVSDDITESYDERRLGALMAGQRNELEKEQNDEI